MLCHGTRPSAGHSGQTRLPANKVFSKEINTILIFTIQFTVMSDKEIQRFIERAEAKLKKGYTKEEARLALYNAGIYDRNGNFRKPYKNLATLFPRK